MKYLSRNFIVLTSIFFLPLHFTYFYSTALYTCVSVTHTIPRMRWSRDKQRRVPLWCSKLRIWCCHCSGLGHHYGLGLLPGLGTSTCHRCSQKKKKKERTKEMNTLMTFPLYILLRNHSRKKFSEAREDENTTGMFISLVHTILIISLLLLESYLLVKIHITDLNFFFLLYSHQLLFYYSVIFQFKQRIYNNF